MSAGNKSEMVKIDGGTARVGFTFDNGVRLSVVFGPCTYSDNYNMDFEVQPEQGYAESTTVEIMQTEGNPALNAWIHRKYGTYNGKSDPIGYVPVKHLPAILKRAASKVYANQGGSK